MWCGTRTGPCTEYAGGCRFNPSAAAADDQRPVVPGPEPMFNGVERWWPRDCVVQRTEHPASGRGRVLPTGRFGLCAHEELNEDDLVGPSRRRSTGSGVAVGGAGDGRAVVINHGASW